MSPLRILQDAIRNEFPDLQMQVRRQHVTYTWNRHLILRLTRMVRYTIVEPDRYGYFTDEYAVVQVFPPLSNMTPVRQGNTITIYWGTHPLCRYKDPQWRLLGAHPREFMKKPVLTGYLWFKFDDEEDEEDVMDIIRQAVANAKSCIRGRRIIQPTGERFTLITAFKKPERYAVPAPAVKKAHKPAAATAQSASKPVHVSPPEAPKPKPTHTAPESKVVKHEAPSAPLPAKAEKPKQEPHVASTPPEKPPSEKPSEKERKCKECGKPLRFIEKYSRWYCDSCKKYEPKEEKKVEVPTPEKKEDAPSPEKKEEKPST